MIHVYPSERAHLHELEGTQCPCGPRVEFPDDSEGLVVHNDTLGDVPKTETMAQAFLRDLKAVRRPNEETP